MRSVAVLRLAAQEVGILEDAEKRGTLPLRCMVGTRNCGATSEELVKQSNNFGIRTNRQHVARRSVMTPGMKLKRVPSVRHEILANNGFANCDHLICHGGDIQSHRHTCIYAPVRRSAIRAPTCQHCRIRGTGKINSINPSIA